MEVGEVEGERHSLCQSGGWRPSLLVTLKHIGHFATVSRPRVDVNAARHMQTCVREI